MASRSDIEAGKAYVRIYAKKDDSLTKIGKSLQSIGTKITALGSAVTAAGGIIIGFGTAAVVQFSNVGDAVDKMASRTGLSTESVSELGHAASLSGTNIESLEVAVRKMQDTLVQASQGSKTAAEAFQRLGLSVTDILKLSPDKQLEAFADALSRIKNPAEQTAAAIDIFGRSGTQLLPLLKSGSKGIQDMRAEARKLGLSLDRETTTSAAQLTDALGRLKSALSGIVTQIGAALAPVVTQASQKIAFITGAVSNWVRHNRTLVVAIGAIGAGLVVIGGLISGVGLGIVSLGAVITSLGTIAAAVFSPLGLVVGGIALLVGSAVYQVYRLTDGFAALKGPVMEVVRLMRGFGLILSQGGIAALATTLEKAGRVLWSFIADALDQLPQLAGWALGRMARVWFDRTMEMYRGLWKIITSIGAALKSALTGDISGAKAILAKGFADLQALAGGFAAGVMKEKPVFRISGETAAAYQALQGDVSTAERRAAFQRQLANQQAYRPPVLYTPPPQPVYPWGQAAIPGQFANMGMSGQTLQAQLLATQRQQLEQQQRQYDQLVMMRRANERLAQGLTF